jgi:hypothetical protein
MKPNDSMTESQKAELTERKRILSEKNKTKYAANREYYIQKSLENRKRRIARTLVGPNADQDDIESMTAALLFSDEK